MNTTEFNALMNTFADACSKSGRGASWEAGFLSAVVKGLFASMTEQQKQYLVRQITEATARNNI